MKRTIINALKAIGLWILQGILGAVFVLGGAFLLAEWFAGCGEAYVDSKGVSHVNECLFIRR